MSHRRVKQKGAEARFSELLEVMDKLLGKNGCPWDKKQTNQSIRRYLLEEAYECYEALREKDWGSFKEELGDLVFQVVFHSRLASKAGRFSIEEVLSSIRQKLVSRHPHVFGTERIRTAKEQMGKWDDYKAKENGKSLLDRVPKHMSALLQSHELQARAHRLGFTWKSIDGVDKKFREEFREWEEARKSRNRKKMEEELGDLLFTLTNVARWLKLNPEEALLAANKKFRKRVARVQEHLQKKNLTIKDCTESQLEELWIDSKRNAPAARSGQD